MAVPSPTPFRALSWLKARRSQATQLPSAPPDRQIYPHTTAMDGRWLAGRPPTDQFCGKPGPDVGEQVR